MDSTEDAPTELHSLDDLTLEAVLLRNAPTEPIQAVLLSLPTLIPLDAFEPPRRKPRRKLAILCGALAGAAVIGIPAVIAGLSAALGCLLVLVSLSLRPGKAEAWVADVVTFVRWQRPELIVPIENLEILAQRAAYASNLALAGAPQEPVYVLPTELIAGPPDIPRAGPQRIPEVGFDPAILSDPLVFAAVADWPRWLTVSRPVLNPAFPNDAALVLKFDLDQAEIHWQPGKVDPWPMWNNERLSDAVPAPDRTGRVPSTGPFVAFGGGFQTLHFPSFGARSDGHDIIGMRDGIQTIAIYDDGRVAIGLWEELPPDGIVEARQNLPPLVHQGKIPANIAFLNVGTLSTQRLDKGGVRTYSNVHTWRSALGIRPDGDLVYVLAARSTPQLLAATLIRAGVVEGMQLDINASSYAAPTLGTPSADNVVTTPLFTGLWDSGRRFVTGADRDFFHVTPRERPVAQTGP